VRGGERGPRAGDQQRGQKNKRANGSHRSVLLREGRPA
jgi:hypothetical protein